MCMWKRLPHGVRVTILAAAALYAAVTVRMFFVLPLLGFVLVGAIIWVAWSVFALMGAVAQVRQARFNVAAARPNDRRSPDTIHLDP